MSEETTPKKIPSNDEVIDDLTKDLETHCIKTDDNEENTQQETNNFNIPEDFENSEPEENTQPNIPDDYVDEEALKDLELTLTDEEKQARQKEALELKNRGNNEFNSADYLKSIETYTEALRLCPLKYESDRAIFYCNRAASKILLERKETAIDDCTKSIELNATYLKAYLRRAKLYEETNKLDESLEDWKKVSELDPANKEAAAANERLPPIINERNEKLKVEMMGKLKDLGNMFLRPFGLSTDNFQLQQDPNTGGYSVNFQK